MTKDEIRQRIFELQDEIERLESELYAPSAEELEAHAKKQKEWKELIEEYKERMAGGMNLDTLAIDAVKLFPRGNDHVESLRLIRDVSGLGFKEAKELWDRYR